MTHQRASIQQLKILITTPLHTRSLTRRGHERENPPE
jgi:hypothetical protein